MQLIGLQRRRAWSRRTISDLCGQRGMAKGFDHELIKEISSNVSIPVIASGGMGKLEHLSDVVKIGKADAVAMAHVLHYEHLSIKQIREYALENDILVRPMEE